MTDDEMTAYCEGPADCGIFDWVPGRGQFVRQRVSIAEDTS